MRISDWSSDVCSSDLQWHRTPAVWSNAAPMRNPYELFAGLRYTRAKRRNHFISFISAASMIGIAVGVTALIAVLSVMNGFERELRVRIDRKSVVSGKSVSVGVGCGGRRIIKKKKQKK